MRVVVKGAGDEHVEVCIAAFASSFDKIRARNGTELRTDEDAGASFGFAFEIPSFGANVIAGPRSERCECDLVFLVSLLNASTLPDTTPPVITLSATPTKFWPPNGRLVPVTLSGTITDVGSGVNVSTAEYAVQDEYGEVQPFGKVTLDSAGNYSFTILLRSGRRGNDRNGRQYTIRVSAKDNAGNRGVQWAQVTVPHDLGK